MIYEKSLNFRYVDAIAFEAYLQLIKIRHCFFSANQTKIANCVSASSLAKHIEASIKRNQYQPDNGSGLFCQYRFFDVELEFRQIRT
jgi:hypothetical protein